MSIHAPKPAIGLDNVPAAETALSHVDGERGELIIAGRRVGDLVAEGGFEHATALLWSSASGRPISAEETQRALGEARVAAFADIKRLLAGTDGMDTVSAFRAALAALHAHDGIAPRALATGAAAVIGAALVRRTRNLAPVAPNAALSHAADYLQMMWGNNAPSDKEAAAMDAYLVTASDHGLNASTFTARVVASTHADLFAAVTAAYCALTGPLHGGAPEPVLDMLDAIGTRERIKPWIENELDKGERLMGFGHRVYRVRDPRADVLKAALERFNPKNARMAFALEVEAAARAALAVRYPKRPLDTNVEFYTALLLDALEIPRAAFTPTFAVSRMAGWTAHIEEQVRRGRLLRPSSVYIGAMPGA
ncbi:MAG: citrate synthase [Alphaproteobacteria bacterium]|nr:citrate synthase [Alphaproteobacteria bacterium]